MKAFLIENRTDETKKRVVDEKIGIIFASTVENAAKILGKKVKEKFPDDPNSVVLETFSDSGILCLISLPIIDSAVLLAAELMRQMIKSDYMGKITI